MSATPNLTTQLIDELKRRGHKSTKLSAKRGRRGKRDIAVDGQKTVATVQDSANGSIRLFVTDKRGTLPAKLAKPFKLTETRGYVKSFKADDDLTPAVEAIAHVASLDAPKSSRKTSTSKTRREAEPTAAEPSTVDIDELLAAADNSDKSVSELNEAASTKQNPSKAQSAKPKSTRKPTKAASKTSTSKPRKTSSTRKTTSRKRSA